MLEAMQPEEDKRETRAFLAKLIEVELNTLHDIAERREVQGIELHLKSNLIVML
jgi:hypothetical protein